MQDNNSNKIIENIVKKALSIDNWTCMRNGCNNKTIKSHLLQRHGVLDNITEDGHMYEVRPKSLFDQSENRMTFQKVGIKNALSWPLFCNKHDTELFKPIECKDLDCSNYKNQLLFSLRAICAELRKKEISLEIYSKILEEIPHPKTYKQLSPSIEGLKNGISDYQTYKELIDKELDIFKHKFHFCNFSYPKIGIYASTILSYIEYNDYAEKVRSEKPWEIVFLHIIPQPSSTQIIIGYHEDYCNNSILKLVNDWGVLNKTTLGEKLTEAFVFHTEGWGLSPSLYRSIPESKKLQYIKIFQDNILFHEANLHTNLNIFENLIEDF